MPEFSSSKIISHRFHIDNNEGESGIGYGMIIGRNLMVQLGLSVYFKCQNLQWDGITVPIKEIRDHIGQTYLTSCDMRKLLMQTAEPFSTREDTERLVKILDSSYVKEDLEQVANNAINMNAEERTLLLRILEDF